jgi:hypothetical protein
VEEKLLLRVFGERDLRYVKQTKIMIPYLL